MEIYIRKHKNKTSNWPGGALMRMCCAILILFLLMPLGACKITTELPSKPEQEKKNHRRKTRARRRNNP